MAPIHHHFEQKGWKEPQIVIRFWIISVVLALVGARDAEAALSSVGTPVLLMLRCEERQRRASKHAPPVGRCLAGVRPSRLATLAPQDEESGGSPAFTA